MSAPSTIVKQLMSDPESGRTSGGTRTDSSELSVSEIKAAAKEGTAEALAEYRRSAHDDDSTARDDTVDESQSKGGSKLKRGALLSLIVVYLLRRRRSGDR